jgi:hypothetical protein
MVRGSKVDTPTPPLDDDSESDFDFEKKWSLALVKGQLRKSCF